MLSMTKINLRSRVAPVGDAVPAAAAASSTAGLLDRLRHRLSPPGRLRDGSKDHRGVQENTTGLTHEQLKSYFLFR